MALLKQVHTNIVQDIARIIMGGFMVWAGIGHLTYLRTEFQAQVPDWVPLEKDLVVVLSAFPEIALGLSMLFWKKQRVAVGITLAIFYVLVFPGNIHQYINHVEGFTLNTEGKRLGRLFLQPVLIAWALWSTGAITALRRDYKDKAVKT
jgi:uncharacterized membrane protein